jgi:hypothetical protein
MTAVARGFGCVGTLVCNISIFTLRIPGLGGAQRPRRCGITASIAGRRATNPARGFPLVHRSPSRRYAIARAAGNTCQ